MNLPATAAAWYGAVVSTLGFALALYVALRDRARVRIRVQANMLAYGNAESAYPPGRRHIAVTVENPSRRTVTVSAVWLTTSGKGGKDILLTESVQPREITEGRSETYIASQEDLPLAKLKRVGVRDQAGRIWTKRVPRTVKTAGNRPSPPPT